MSLVAGDDKTISKTISGRRIELLLSYIITTHPKDTGERISILVMIVFQ